jgi:hypothetical protein
MLGRLKGMPLLQRMLLIWSMVQRSSQLLAKTKKIFYTRGTQKLKSEVGVSIKIIHQTIERSAVQHTAPSLLSRRSGMTQKVE